MYECAKGLLLNKLDNIATGFLLSRLRGKTAVMPVAFQGFTA